MYDKKRSRLILIEAALKFAQFNIGKYSSFEITHSPKSWNTGIKSMAEYDKCQEVEDFVNNYGEAKND